MAEEKLNVYQKLQKVRVELQDSKIKKSGKNAYAGFTYYELKDFIPTLNDLMDKYGLCSNFSIRDNTADLFITNTDQLDEFIVFTSPIAEVQLKGCTPIQALGAVHTYMKRYLYLNAFEIVEDDLLDPQVGNIKQTDGDFDKKIIEEMNKISSISELNKFYETNKNEMNDIKKLRSAYTIRAKEITNMVKEA